MPGRLEPEPMPRRDFLGLAGVLAAGAAVLASFVGMLRLPNPRVLPESARAFRIGRPEDFPPGTSRVLSERKLLIVARSEGVAAISMVCSHLGCVVRQGPQGFSCPCHGSAFDNGGEVVAGPAPRALPWFEVSQGIDGRLVVDASREVPVGTYYAV